MRRLPQVVVATIAVVGIPIVIVSVLNATGTVTSVMALMAVSVALSLGASYLGSAVWATRKASGGMLFADLMVWGWLRRWLLERQLTSAVRLLGLRTSGRAAQLSSNQRVRLLKRLATGLEARYPDTHGHSHRVAHHATAIAKSMGLESSEVARIRTAATVHDIGKLYVPSTILNKPGKLTVDEFAAIKKHAEIGATMVANLGDQELVRIVRHHHERLDGAGYPDGLIGTQIPLGARIIAVADTFDAITSTRPHRSAMRHKDGLEILATQAGTQLDVAAVRAFRRYYSGHRPVALWALLLNGFRQLLASLVGQAKLGGVVAATALTTFTAGEIATHAPRDPGQSDAPLGSAVATAFPGGSSPSTSPDDRGFSVRPKDGAHAEGLAEAGLRGGAETGRGDTTSTDEPDSIGGSTKDVGSTAGSEAGSGSDGSGSSGGGSPAGNVVSRVGDSASRVVSSVTTPTTSAVGSVVETADSTAKKSIGSTVPGEVGIQPVLPNVPPIKLPGD